MVSTWARKAVVPVFASAAVIAAATPAAAQPPQDGLVNVAIGDVTVLRSVAVAAQVVAAVCGVQVGPIAVLARTIDRSGGDVTVCTTCGLRSTPRRRAPRLPPRSWCASSRRARTLAGRTVIMII